MLPPPFSHRLAGVGMFPLFFLVMGIERFLAEIHKGFFRTEDQEKYFIPSRITFFGRHVESDILRYAAGTLIVAAVFAVTLIDDPVHRFVWFVLIAYATGLVVSLGGAYKDAPFRGVQTPEIPAVRYRAGLPQPALLLLNDPAAPVSAGFLIYMNGGLERFSIEYYKTYVQRNMSGKFRPDLERLDQFVQAREKFHYLALVIVAALAVLYVVEVRAL